jgi:hypothetical protein
MPKLTLILYTLTLVLAGATSATAQITAGGGGGAGGVGGFGGPAILGRSPGNATGMRGGSEVGLRFYAGLNFTYDSALTAFAVDSTGRVANNSIYGVDGVLGVYGVKRFRRGQIGLNYQGGYRQYANQDGFNGTDQTLSLSIAKQPNARSAIQFAASIGTTNRAFGIPILGGIVDPSFAAFALPTNEIFDNRLYYGNASVSQSWQRTARLSFSVHGNLFLTRRTGNVLFGMNGAGAGADIAYRLSRRQTIGIGYNYFLFNFTRNFGSSHGHGASMLYSAQLGRRSRFDLRAGTNRMDIIGLRTQEVDPVIASLIGVTSVQEVFRNVTYLPNIVASFSSAITRKVGYDITFNTMAMPGNGVINTSRNNNASFGVSYTGFREWSIGGSVGYNRMSSISGDAQVFESLQAGMSTSRRITSDFFFTLTAGNRKFYQSTTNLLNRNTYFVTGGIYWSPGATPLAIR